MDIIANLTKVDAESRFDRIFAKFYGNLADEVMITAAHVVDGSAKIAKAKPNLSGRITGELLNVEKASRNQECKNILLGKATLAFDRYFNQISDTDKDKVISFVKRQLNNTRVATKKKAEKFLSKHS